MKFGTYTLTLVYGTTYALDLGALSVRVQRDCTNFMGSGGDLWTSSLSHLDTPLLSGEGPTGQDALDHLWKQVECLRPLLR